MATTPQPRRWYQILYVQVLLGVAVGIFIGWYWPDTGKSLKPLGDGFIKLIKMIVAPIVFCTVAHGISAMRDLKKLGRIGAKTLLYFEIVSTIALVIGLVVVNWLRPGDGLHYDAHKPPVVAADAAKIETYKEQAKHLTFTEFALNIIPSSFFGAFATGDLLQVLLIAVLSGFAISLMGERGNQMQRGLDYASHVFFGIMSMVVKLAPIGAMGAMAYTIGEHGLGALKPLAKLMGSFYVTAIVFIVVVLGLIARVAGFSIFRMILYIREELLLVLGTSSSETALPGLIQKMRRLGCTESTVGLVVPTGYSFNLDGTNIYLTMAAVFLAQATDTPLDLRAQITLLAVAMLSSKGAGAVTGAGLITLAATLAATNAVPVESLVLILGIDRFMSECRALTNLVGNSVATVVISRWENEITPEQLDAAFKPPAG